MMMADTPARVTWAASGHRSATDDPDREATLSE